MPNYTDDELMIYNLTEHRYDITEEGLNAVGIYLDLNEEQTDSIELAKTKWRTRLSRTLYTVLWSYGKRVKANQYYLSLPELRQYILQALQTLAEAWVINRFDPGIVLTDQPVDLIPPILKAFITATRLACTSYISVDTTLTYGVDY